MESDYLPKWLGRLHRDADDETPEYGSTGYDGTTGYACTMELGMLVQVL